RPMSRPTTTAASPIKCWAAALRRSPISARRNRSTQPTGSASNSSACSVSDRMPRSRLKQECLQVAAKRKLDKRSRAPAMNLIRRCATNRMTGSRSQKMKGRIPSIGLLVACIIGLCSAAAAAQPAAPDARYKIDEEYTQKSPDGAITIEQYLNKDTDD